jgi:zinc and cadmium transporter
MPLLWILSTTIAISLIALIGLIVLVKKTYKIEKFIHALVGLAAGAMIGGAFLHLLPESFELAGKTVMFYLLLGFILFFIFEKLLWRHCHDKKCKIHPFAYLNLIGDSIHNFIDGLIIAASFITSIPLGIATVIAVALHEIPQELGDFGVLVHGGFSKQKALCLNFLSALTAVAGGLIGFFISVYIQTSMIFLLPFTAGSFIYIACSDLIPELHKEPDQKKSWLSFLLFLIGIGLMYGLVLLG